VLIDVSTSTTSNAMPRRLFEEGARLPGLWLVDADGRPSDDPTVLFGERPGAVMPLGGFDLGYKGFALRCSWKRSPPGSRGTVGRTNPASGAPRSSFSSSIRNASPGAPHSSARPPRSPSSAARPPWLRAGRRYVFPAKRPWHGAPDSSRMALRSTLGYSPPWRRGANGWALPFPPLSPCRRVDAVDAPIPRARLEPTPLGSAEFPMQKDSALRSRPCLMS
jgi:hypothetical protein